MRKLLLFTFCLVMILAACQINPVSTPVPSGTPVPTVPSPLETPVNYGLNNAIQMLAQQLSTDTSQIKVISVEAVDWPDACLGVNLQGRVCAQVITPGYRIILQALGKQYEYHTDQSGGNVILASSPTVNVGSPLIIWESATQPCQTAEVGLFGVAVGDCGGALVQTMFTNGERVSEVQAFVNSYQSFSIETPAGKITLNGKGSRATTASEQRSIAEWANLVYMEAIGGRGGAAWGLAFTWHRVGGIAGFCQDLTIYRDGFGTSSDCRSLTPTPPITFLLDSSQLDQLYHYLDTYQPADIDRQDNPGGPDNMTVTMSFAGTGSQVLTDAIRQELMAFASSVYFSSNQ